MIKIEANTFTRAAHTGLVLLGIATAAPQLAHAEYFESGDYGYAMDCGGGNWVSSGNQDLFMGSQYFGNYLHGLMLCATEFGSLAQPVDDAKIDTFISDANARHLAARRSNSPEWDGKPELPQGYWRTICANGATGGTYGHPGAAAAKFCAKQGSVVDDIKYVGIANDGDQDLGAMTGRKSHRAISR